MGLELEEASGDAVEDFGGDGRCVRRAHETRRSSGDGRYQCLWVWGPENLLTYLSSYFRSSYLGVEERQFEGVRAHNTCGLWGWRLHLVLDIGDRDLVLNVGNICVHHADLVRNLAGDFTRYAVWAAGVRLGAYWFSFFFTRVKKGSGYPIFIFFWGLLMYYLPW